jgi:glycosyltransferase involved in cell wall biosynthesis
VIWIPLSSLHASNHLLSDSMHAKRIRALYLQPAALFGGAERQAATNIPLLDEFGVDVLAMVGPGDPIITWLHERGVERFVHTQSFPGAWPKQDGLRRLSLPWRYLRCLERCADEIAALVEGHAIEVIFAALPFSWIAATPVARRLGVPIVWRAGGTEITAAQRLLLSGCAVRWRPDLLLCNAEAVRRTYEPLVRAPTEVVQNGVDDAQFYPKSGDPARFRPAAAGLVVGFAGRLVPQKRPEDFIELAARFAALGPEVTFLAAGEGSRRDRYEELARRAGADHLRFLGYVDDMRSFYAACDVLVLPSRSEGCPNVVLEAMAMGAVVIASDVAGTREVMRHGVEGLIYPIGEVGALAAELTRLWREPARLRALARRALARTHRDLTARACARRTGELLRTVIADHALAKARAPATRRPPRSRPTPAAAMAPPARASARTAGQRTRRADRRGTGERRTARWRRRRRAPATAPRPPRPGRRTSRRAPRRGR